MPVQSKGFVIQRQWQMMILLHSIEAAAIGSGAEAGAHLQDALSARRHCAREAYLSFQDVQEPQRSERGFPQRIAHVPTAFAIEIESEPDSLHRCPCSCCDRRAYTPIDKMRRQDPRT